LLIYLSGGFREMAISEPISRMIVSRAASDGDDENIIARSAVLSCGGIYIPHRGNRHSTLQHILTMPRKDEPVKIITGAGTKNMLHELLLKESMN
jgi:hypothetical protein